MSHSHFNYIKHVYHTGLEEIRIPDIHHGRVNADFGQGFYLTPDRDFTYRWARKGSVVNEYELDISGLTVHSFTRTEDWFSYIFNNRRGQDGLQADVVIGPIANDTIFETFGFITSGYLEPSDALKLLMIGPEYTQVAIKSQKAVDQLRWIGSHVIEDVDTYQAALQKEKEEYQQRFAEVMEKIAE